MIAFPQFSEQPHVPATPAAKPANLIIAGGWSNKFAEPTYVQGKTVTGIHETLNATNLAPAADVQTHQNDQPSPAVIEDENEEDRSGSFDMPLEPTE